MNTNKLLCAAALAASALALSSCQEPEGEQTAKGSFDAKISSDYIYTVKSAVDEEGAITWIENEDFSVNGVDYYLAKGAGTNVGVIAPVEADFCAEPLLDTPLFKACSPASLFNIENGQYELPSTILNYGRYNPMYAVSNDNTLEFKNICGIFELTVRGTKTITSIDLCASNLGLAGRYKIGRDATDTTLFVMQNTNDFRGPVKIEFEEPVTLSSAGTKFLIPVAAKTYKWLSARFTASDGTVAEYAFDNPEAPLEIGVDQRVPMICTPEFKAGTDHLLPGIFSVSATKHIKFTEGNLYWDGVKKEFAIEAFQFAGSPLELSGSNGNGFGGRCDPTHWTHFLWSSDPQKAIAPVIKTENLPVNGDTLFCINGGAIPGLTVPTKAEVDYLLKERTVNGGKGKGYSYKVLFDAGYKIDGMAGLAGLLVYPDNYAGSYNEATWAEIKKAGIVYLPTAGYYNATNDWCGQLKGGSSYWLNGTPGASDSKAERWLIDKTNKDSSASTAEVVKLAYSVRLVKYID